MPDTPHQPSLRGAHAPAAVLEPHASEPDWDDDLALGCECANPALQIERWRQEAASSPDR